MQTPPQQLVAHVARLFPDALFYKETSKKVVALTIDDVPTPNETDDASTLLILDAIATHNQSIASISDQVRATFFVISNHLCDETTIMERILEQGHELGNHGTADETTALLHPEVFATQLSTAHQCIVRQHQQPLRWYRPGRGLYNKAMLHCLQQMPGYVPRFALASMLPVDTFKPTDDGLFTAWYVTQHIFPGAILLLHGGSAARCRQTAKALTLILAELKQRNYQTVTLSELWDME
ncbi:MAG: polysaccharide deacetylase family protein [Oscillatoriales cyanobacterium C42_A2020_001]|nr:polysaccharide deacetylase family protein [Leptolyngbyaceae cyanobacterium C42_A2020_001]